MILYQLNSCLRSEEVRREATRSISIKTYGLVRCYLGEGAWEMGVLCVWSDPCGVGRRGAGVILLICESCHRPLEDESLSGRVMYSDNAHTEGGSDFSSRRGMGGGPTGSFCILRSHNGFELQNQLKRIPRTS